MLQKHDTIPGSMTFAIHNVPQTVLPPTPASAPPSPAMLFPLMTDASM